MTATKTKERAVDVPATLIVITKEQIRERGYRNLFDIFKDLPDVDIRENTSEEAYNVISLRGNFSQEKFIIMMDGYRVSSPTNEPIPIADNFPLYNVKQVEVVFGPASALYGADAFAGVVNIITKDAMELDGAHMTASAGSFGYANHYVNLGGRLYENVKLSAGGHWHESDNADLSEYYDEYDMNVPLVTYAHYTTAESNEREDFYGKTKSYSAYAKLVLADSFTLGYSESYFRHPSTAGVMPGWSYFGSDARWETLIKNYYGEYRSDRLQNTVGKTSISYLTYEVLPGSKYRNRYVDFQDSYKYAHSRKFMLEQQVDHKMEDHTIIGGASFESFYALPKTYDLLGRKYDPDRPPSEQQYYYGGTNNTLPVKIYELNYENYGAYLQARSYWSDSFSSTLGVRYDYNSRYGETTNPRGGIVIKPQKKTVIKLLYGEAYLAPSPYKAYAYHFGVFDHYSSGSGEYVSEFMSLPNPDLKPEKTKTAELALLHKFDKEFSFEILTYYTEVENLIFGVEYDTPSDYIEGGLIESWKRNENVGKATYYGGHLAIDYDAKIGGAGIKYWGNYTHTDGIIDEGDGVDRKPPYVTRNKIKGGLTLSYGKYFISPIVKWIGETTSSWIDRDETKEQTVRAYTLVNLNMGVRDLAKDLSASLNIQNLFDVRYYTPGGGKSNFVKAPQEPRKIIFSLNYKL
ncbi:MAG: TonB-dependent receptor [Deltaproteobacteria bacterium]|nr:TonB-dependent receptor [Deltaproteobacteria bacterium]